MQDIVTHIKKKIRGSMTNCVIKIEDKFGKRLDRNDFTLTDSIQEASIYNLSHDSGGIAHAIGWLINQAGGEVASVELMNADLIRYGKY